MKIGDFVTLNMKNHDRGIGIITEINSNDKILTRPMTMETHEFRVYWPKDNVEYSYSRHNLDYYSQGTKLTRLLFKG